MAQKEPCTYNYFLMSRPVISKPSGQGWAIIFNGGGVRRFRNCCANKIPVRQNMLIIHKLLELTKHVFLEIPAYPRGIEPFFRN